MNEKSVDDNMGARWILHVFHDVAKDASGSYRVDRFQQGANNLRIFST